MKETESEFLLRHGWKLMIIQGRTKYWYHPKHKREDSAWWAQGTAYIHQRKVNREEGKKANS